MSKSNTFENDLLLLIFNNTNIANIGDATGLRGSSAAGSLYVSLHTSDPGEGASQTTNEISYTNYARVAVARSAAGFTVSNNSVNLTSIISFPLGGAGSSPTATHFAIGTADIGAGKVLYSGTVTPNIVCGDGITPQLSTAAGIVTED